MKKRPPKDAELKDKKLLDKSTLYKQSLHALERIDRRKVSFQDVLVVLENGHREEAKDSYDEAFKSWKYATRGYTLEGIDLRVIITIHMDNIIIITVVNLTIKESA